MRMKFLIGALVAGGLILATTIGVALAQSTTPTPNAEEVTPKDKYLEELAKQLGVDVAKLKESMEQAQQGVVSAQMDEALQAKLDALVKAGKLTQAEADQIKAWWAARPEVANKLVLGMFGPPHGKPIIIEGEKRFGLPHRGPLPNRGFFPRDHHRGNRDNKPAAPTAPATTPTGATAAVYSY